MVIHPIDFELNQDQFSTPELKAIFHEKAVIQRWLDFESALAKAQGELGVIPQEAAKEISARARLDELNLEEIREGYSKSRNSLIPVIRALKSACRGEAGQFVHYGPTTQDVLDTAQILGIRKALSIFYRDLRFIEKYCLDLIEKYGSVPMVGRTHGQQALPIIFGLKVAYWLKENRRHIQRTRCLYENLDKGQFGGAAGTLAALGPVGPRVAKRTLEILGLKYDMLAWHTSRDQIAEVACFLSMVTATLAKIANEVFQLQRPEIGELYEPPPKGASSSTMPQKSNPVVCQRVVTIFKHVRMLAPVVVESMCHEHERDPRCLWAEWMAIPQLCIFAGAAANYMKDVLGQLDVRDSRLRANLNSSKDFITSEWLLFRLAETMGKMRAMDKLRSLLAKASKEKRPLKDVLMEDEEAKEGLASQDLSVLEKPELYIGQAEEIVRSTVQEVRDARGADPNEL